MTTTHQPRPSDTTAERDPITNWLLMVAGLIVLMILIGGFVRLSRAGLSIVEWDVLGGILPPIGDEAWADTFAAYQQTPEYQLVNKGMSLSDYQRIFYIEWGHRLIARIVGLIVVLPLLWFHRRRLISAKESLRYWAVAGLFAFQGLIGWLMVSSGLRDRPLVSQYRLTIHLLTALALLGLVLWMAYDRMDGADKNQEATLEPGAKTVRNLSWLLVALTLLQIAYGGLVAGLRSGHLSNTWPLMFGQLIPEGLLSSADTFWASLVDPLGSHWIHRWFAFVVASAAVALFIHVRRGGSDAMTVRRLTNWLIGAIAIQIALGITVVLLGVPKWFALAHQGMGVAVFMIALTMAHRAQSHSLHVSAR